MPIINQIRLFPPEEEWEEEAGDWGRYYKNMYSRTLKSICLPILIPSAF